jgi:hypothetical protein
MFKCKSLLFNQISILFFALIKYLAVHVDSEDPQIFVPFQKAYTVITPAEGAVQKLKSTRCEILVLSIL